MDTKKAIKEVIKNFLNIISVEELSEICREFVTKEDSINSFNAIANDQGFTVGEIHEISKGIGKYFSKINFGNALGDKIENLLKAYHLPAVFEALVEISNSDSNDMFKLFKQTFQPLDLVHLVYDNMKSDLWSYIENQDEKWLFEPNIKSLVDYLEENHSLKVVPTNYHEIVEELQSDPRFPFEFVYTINEATGLIIKNRFDKVLKKEVSDEL